MRRRLAYLLSAALIMTSAAVFTSAQPAAATAVCAGLGTATVSPGLYYPPGATATVNPSTVWIHATIGKAGQSTFTLPPLTTGGCVLKELLPATGLVLGWCGLSAGGGTTANGGTFGWVGVGGLLIITGHVIGVVNALPDVAAGESCAPTGPGADSFLVQGAVALIHCTLLQTIKGLPINMLIPVFATHTVVNGTLVGLDVSVHAQWHTWTSVCVPGLL